jgi:flagellar hook-basal body complex protein FliE
MTTPWNLSTGSATYLNFNNTFGFTAVNDSTTDWFFNSDGTRFFINSGTKGTVIKQYNLTTAYDLTTASDTNLSLTISNSSEVYHMQKADNGTKLIYAGKAAGQSTQLIGVYDLIIDDGTTTPSYNQYFPNVTNTSGQIDTAAWTDINSMTADEAVGNGTVNYAVSTDDRTIWKIAHNTSGIRSIAKNNSGTWQYNSNATYGSETWTNSTTNSELAALQQALSVSQNRMDKSQLDAVTDANHFTLGDTLDLMIAVQMASGSTVPKSDGVSINYDAATLVRQAAAGTDYEAEFPSSTSVKIKSLAAQNLKVRVI